MFDLAGLVVRLPDIQEGASKWIRALEEETVGKLLASGDIKAVRVQCFGAPTIEDILKHSNNGWMLNPRADETEFSAYRAMLWRAWLVEYPTRVDPKALRGEPLLDPENSAPYITQEMKK